MTVDQMQIQEGAVSEPISFSHIARVLKRYAGVIVLALACVVITYLIVGITILLRAPVQRTASVPFRLEFRGADRGEYPNGLRFSVADITAAPVLMDVYNANNLARFTSFDHFSRSFFVLEANRALEALATEYEKKLADAESSVDRERIEREYESKRASISKSDYALQFAFAPEVDEIPLGLVPKILDETLRTWARRAAVEKKVLDYQVPPLTANILADIQVRDNDYLIPLLLLRRRVDDLMKNLDRISTIPGSQLVTSKKEKKSLDEIRLTLDELIRFRLEPLIAAAKAGGLLGSSSDALRILRAQLSYDERALAAARGREAALRSALSTYESTQQTARLASPPSTSSGAEDSRARETVMPQLSDTFLEKIVDLASVNADRDYRQRLTDEIKVASLNVVPLEAAVKYDQELIDSFRSASSPGTVPSMAIGAQWTSVMESVREAISQLNEIHTIASRQLYPETEIYRVIGPPVTRSLRSVSPIRLAVGGVLTFLISIPLIVIGVLIHNRIREEEAAVARRT